MKVCVLKEPGRLELEERPDPVADSGDVVIRVESALTCGTDLKAFRRGHPKMPCPTVFGHEYAGTVVDVGGGVETFAVGDPLMAANTGPCQTCFFCKRDQENLCESIMDEMVLGAYAEYLRVPARVVRRNAFVKPSDMAFDTAALLEPLSSVCAGLALLPAVQLRPPATVLLIGAGPISMLWLLALRAHGAERIVVLGRRAPRLAVAGELGALATFTDGDALDTALGDLTDGRGFDAVVECTGLPEVWERSVSLCRRGGTAVLFGGCATGTEVRLDPYRLHYDGVRVVSPFHFRPRDVAESKRLLTMAELPWPRLITDHATLAEVPAVFERLAGAEGLKCAVHPHEAAGVTP